MGEPGSSATVQPESAEECDWEKWLWLLPAPAYPGGIGFPSRPVEIVSISMTASEKVGSNHAEQAL